MDRDPRGSAASGERILTVFIEGLTTGSSRAVAPPGTLVRLAASASEGLPGISPEDLVSELVVRLLDRIRRGEPPLGTNVRSVRAVLRHRLWQIAVEHAPSRRVLKELTVHVGRALETRLPAKARRPSAIERDGRFDRGAVAQAVAWAVREANVPREPRALARWLAMEFDLLVERQPCEVLRQLAHPDGSGLDGLRVARRLAARLGARKVALLRLRLKGASLREMSAETGVPTTRVFEEMRAIEAVLTDEVAASGVEAHQLREALRLFAGMIAPHQSSVAIPA